MCVEVRDADRAATGRCRGAAFASIPNLIVSAVDEHQTGEATGVRPSGDLGPRLGSGVVSGIPVGSRPGLVIHSIYHGYWLWGRPSVEDLRRDLRDVLQEIRQDWNLSTPGLREKWEAGDLITLPRVGSKGE